MRTETELDQLMDDCFKEISGAQIYDETRRLLSVLNRMPPVLSMVEIGSEEGGTLRVWTKLWESLTAFTVDMNSYGHANGRTAELEARWRTWLTPAQTLDCVWGDSHAEATKGALLSKMAERGTSKVDFLFIDGDHAEEGVEQDFNMYKELVRPGGLIVFHDIHPYRGREFTTTSDKPGVGVYKFLDRLKEKPIDQRVSREYHRGARPPFIEICHDCATQDSFGFLLLFV